MADSEYLDRIDRHMERGNRHMERGNRHMERGNRHMERGNELMEQLREEMRLSREQRARSDAMFDDLREFMREITLRVERGGREMVKELRDLQGETRAQTQAILTVLDRLDPGGSAA